MKQEIAGIWNGIIHQPREKVFTETKEKKIWYEAKNEIYCKGQ